MGGGVELIRGAGRLFRSCPLPTPDSGRCGSRRNCPIGDRPASGRAMASLSGSCGVDSVEPWDPSQSVMGPGFESIGLGEKTSRKGIRFRRLCRHRTFALVLKNQFVKGVFTCIQPRYPVEERSPGRRTEPCRKALKAFDFRNDGVRCSKHLSGTTFPKSVEQGNPPDTAGRPFAWGACLVRFGQKMGPTHTHRAKALAHTPALQNNQKW